VNVSAAKPRQLTARNWAGLQRSARSRPIRVMIVDDSLTVRAILKRMVETDPLMEIVGTASSGEVAIALLRDDPVDVVLLDLEMPGIGGIDALPTILATAPQTQVLVVSALTRDGAEHTLEALSLGAADTMLKPLPGGFTEDYRSDLLGRIRALGGRNGSGCAHASEPEALVPPVPQKALHKDNQPEVLAIGASTGGIHALNLMLRGLPREFDLPILITQHLPPSFIPVFARQIESACQRKTEVARDELEIRRGQIVIASAEGHLLVRRKAGALVARLCDTPATSGCRPSVDPMLASLAESCEGRALAVILSGMGRDGLEGAKKLAAAGGMILAQDPDSSAVWGMPGAVARAGLASLVACPAALAEAIAAIARPMKKDRR
jgi:two-component system, chemotaxis family, protein-glutamate methylesterase/glutaminase